MKKISEFNNKFIEVSHFKIGIQLHKLWNLEVHIFCIKYRQLKSFFLCRIFGMWRVLIYHPTGTQSRQHRTRLTCGLWTARSQIECNRTAAGQRFESRKTHKIRLWSPHQLTDNRSRQSDAFNSLLIGRPPLADLYLANLAANCIQIAVAKPKSLGLSHSDKFNARLIDRKRSMQNWLQPAIDCA